MPNILIIYYSRTGNTEKLAQHVARGVKEVKGVHCVAKPVEEVSPEELTKYDGIIMGSPVYYGTIAAELKKLIDESVTYHGELEGKVGAAFASSGGQHSGNETTVVDILRVMLVHGMIVQGNHEGDHYGAVAVGAPDDRSQEECATLGRRTAHLALRLAK